MPYKKMNLEKSRNTNTMKDYKVEEAIFDAIKALLADWENWSKHPFTNTLHSNKVQILWWRQYPQKMYFVRLYTHLLYVCLLLKYKDLPSPRLSSLTNIGVSSLVFCFFFNKSWTAVLLLLFFRCPCVNTFAKNLECN